MPAQRGFQLVSGASRGIGLALTQQLLRQGGAGVHAAPRVVAVSKTDDPQPGPPDRDPSTRQPVSNAAAYALLHRLRARHLEARNCSGSWLGNPGIVSCPVALALWRAVFGGGVGTELRTSIATKITCRRAEQLSELVARADCKSNTVSASSSWTWTSAARAPSRSPRPGLTGPSRPTPAAPHACQSYRHFGSTLAPRGSACAAAGGPCWSCIG